MVLSYSYRGSFEADIRYLSAKDIIGRDETCVPCFYKTLRRLYTHRVPGATCALVPRSVPIRNRARFALALRQTTLTVGSGRLGRSKGHRITCLVRDAHPMMCNTASNMCSACSGRTRSD